MTGPVALHVLRCFYLLVLTGVTMIANSVFWHLGWLELACHVFGATLLGHVIAYGYQHQDQGRDQPER